MTDDGQTDQKTDDGQTVFENDESSKKIMFLVEHMFLKVPHHVPNYVHFYRLNQPATIHT